MVAAAVIGSAVVGVGGSMMAAESQADSAAAAGAQQQQQFNASSAAAERQQAQARADALAQQERVRMDTIAQNRQIRTDTIAQNQQFRNDTQQTRDAGSFALDAMTVGMGGGRRVLRQPPPGTSAAEIEVQRQKGVAAQQVATQQAAQQVAAQQAAQASQAAAAPKQPAARVPTGVRMVRGPGYDEGNGTAASNALIPEFTYAPDPPEDLANNNTLFPSPAPPSPAVPSRGVPSGETAGSTYGGGSGEISIPREAYYEIDPSTATGKGEFNADFSMADFQKDPGYDFRMAEGRRALEGSAVARGGLLSGGTLKALTRYGQDAGSAEYGNAYQRYNADRDRRFNRLATIAGTGQTATASTGNNSSSALGQINQAGANAVSQINSSGNQAVGNINQGAANTTTSLAQLGQVNSNAQGSALIQAGNASASGIMGVSNAITSGVNGYMNYNQSQQMLNMMGRQ